MTDGPFKNSCILTRKGWHWARRGHPWIYRDDVQSLGGENGEIVRVAHENRLLGSAFLGTRSKIALRWLERSSEPAFPDAAFWRRRLLEAHERRAGLRAKTDAYRAVHDAADGFPGLVVDRYGPAAVLQTTIAGTERLIPTFTELLQEVLGVSIVAARNDAAVREKEGLPEEVKVLCGECPEVLWVHEDGPCGRVEFPVQPLTGQKTGAYLDQRENRWAAAARARGRMLDAFGYTGLFALHTARNIAEGLVVDSSGPALELCGQAAARNRFANLSAVQQNVFDFLKESRSRGERFDTIILDPPAFAKSRKDLPAARRGYRDLNRRAMEILSPGGLMATCSCSYNLGEEAFLEVLRQAAMEARCDFRVLERRTQSSDHPILLCHPESQYLKCCILEKI